MIKKNYFESSGRKLAHVTFSLPRNIWADRINLVGDFNGWDRLSHPFQRDREGAWTISVDLELGQSYKFYYLSDGADQMYEAQARELSPLADAADSPGDFAAAMKHLPA
jgi:1,4-alpha-glucan branching enzyme